MYFYEYLITTTKGTLDEDGNVVIPPTMTETITGFFYTGVYSAIIILFGTLYKILASIQTKSENH